MKVPEKYLGPFDLIGQGDSQVAYDLDLPPDMFHKIQHEVEWQRMYHLSGQVPRLVAVQGMCNTDGSVPIYRHPADEAPPLRPFTPNVHRIGALLERALGQGATHYIRNNKYCANLIMWNTQSSITR